MKNILFTLALSSLVSADTIPVLIGTGADGIYRSDLDRDTGKLSEARLVGPAKNAGFLALSTDSKLVVSTAKIDKKGAVSSWKVTKDGVDLINSETYDGGGLCQVSFDHTHQMVMGADYGGGKLVSFPIDSSGKLGPNASLHQHEVIDPRPAPQNQARVHATWPGPDNKFAYVPDLGIDRVKIYAMNLTDGTLDPVGAAVSPPGSGPRHMKFSGDGMHAYVLNELTLSVTVFKRSPETSALKEVQTVSVFAEGGEKDKKEDKMSCSEILVSKDGKFVYTGNRDLTGPDRDSVSVLAVKPDGTLKHLQTVTSGVWIVRNIALSPEGDYLLCSGQKSNQVSTIKVDTKTGKMTPTGHSTAVPVAMCVVFPTL
ncbi:lactonase family protein [Akkermansiaceae bacterium]|nr:lactonase family protein [Akkermansiaceae bacterium]